MPVIKIVLRVDHEIDLQLLGFVLCTVGGMCDHCNTFALARFLTSLDCPKLERVL